jgi:hypothetical protein
VREITATVAWLDDEPLVAGRVYWALQGHRWVKAKVARIVHRLNITTLESEPRRAGSQFHRRCGARAAAAAGHAALHCNRAPWARWCWSIRPATRPLAAVSCSPLPQRPKIWVTVFYPIQLTLKDK